MRAAQGDPNGKFTSGFGLAQWTFERKEALLEFAGTAEKAAELDTQISFLIKELRTTEKAALDALRQTTSPERAAEVFEQKFERAGIKAQGERNAFARASFGRLTSRDGIDKPSDPAADALQQAASDLPRPQAPQLQDRSQELTQQNQELIRTQRQLLQLDRESLEVDKARALERLRTQGIDQNAVFNKQQELQQSQAGLAALKQSSGLNQLEVSLLQQRVAAQQELATTEKTRVNNIKALEEAARKQGVDEQTIKALVAATNENFDKRKTIIEETLLIDQQLLRNERERSFLIQKNAKTLEKGLAGAGLQAGFIGAAGQEFESALSQGFSTQQATELAKLTEETELATNAARALEGAYVSVAGAISNTLTNGIADIVAGTKSAEEVFKEFLDSIASALLQTASTLIAQYIAIGIARAFAFGGSSSGSSGFNLTGFGSLNGGNAFPINPPKLFADGGRPPVGETSIVGERGPELFVPDRPGTIVPNEFFQAAQATTQAWNDSGDRERS